MDRIDHPLHPGLHLFPVQGRILRRRPGGPAARAPREIRAERPQLQNPCQETRAQMNRHPAALAPALRACARRGVRPTPCFLAVNIARQRAALFRRRGGGYAPVKTFRCSTSKFGIGERAGSNMTPRGLHRVAQKIGGGWPVGAVFKGRRAHRLHLARPARGAHRPPHPLAGGIGAGLQSRRQRGFLPALHLHSRHRQRNRPWAVPIPTAASISPPTTCCRSMTHCRKERWFGWPLPALIPFPDLQAYRPPATDFHFSTGYMDSQTCCRSKSLARPLV